MTKKIVSVKDGQGSTEADVTPTNGQTFLNITWGD